MLSKATCCLSLRLVLTNKRRDRDVRKYRSFIPHCLLVRLPLTRFNLPTSSQPTTIHYSLQVSVSRALWGGVIPSGPHLRSAW